MLKPIRTMIALGALAVATGCAGLQPLQGGNDTASLQALQDDGPEVVHLPRYAIAGAPPSNAATVTGLAAIGGKLAKAKQEQFDVVTLFYATNRAALPVSARKVAGVDPLPAYSSSRAVKF